MGRPGAPEPKGQQKELGKAVARVIERYEKLANLAQLVGCSISTLSAWKKGSTQIGWEDAISMGLRDLDCGNNAYERAVFWLKLCGHESRLGELDLQKEIKKRTSAGEMLDDELEKIKVIAGMEGRGIRSEDFRLAFSCYLGQKRLRDDIKRWMSASNGQGTMAYFWRWHENTCMRFEKKALKEFVEELIKQPSADVAREWKPPSMESLIEVCIFLQINFKNEALSSAMSQLKQAVRDFREDLRLNRVEKVRFSVYTTSDQYRHPADACVFASPPPGRSFAVLVSENSELVKAAEKSTDPEIIANPYAWSGQIIHIEDLAAFKEDYLAECSVGLSDGKFTWANHWSLLTETADQPQKKARAAK